MHARPPLFQVSFDQVNQNYCCWLNESFRADSVVPLAECLPNIQRTQFNPQHRTLVHVCNLSTQMKAEGSKLQVIPGSIMSSRPALGCIRSCLKTNNNDNKISVVYK